MDIKGYMPRLIDKKIEEYLKAFGAVCVEGAKWCGKTWTSEFHSNSAIFFIGNLLAAVIACLHILPPVLVCVFLFYGKRAGKSIEESPSPRKRPEGRKKEPPRREALSFA